MYRPQALAALGLDYRYGGKESLDAVDAMALRRGERLEQEQDEDAAQ